DTAHRHGTRVLGTFITEWEEGHAECSKLLCSEETIFAGAERMALIAIDYGFDGWLVNIENPLDVRQELAGMVTFLKVRHTRLLNIHKTHNLILSMLCHLFPSCTIAWTGGLLDQVLTSCMHKKLPGSVVMWYDSVTSEGDLKWQNCLNSHNQVFFDACDGIYTNYAWKDDTPQRCAIEAKDRRFDVYMGIDVFGRGTWGGGGMDSSKVCQPP
ncbi:unnamed protein product, partial [Choristocarpus tenellus]